METVKIYQAKDKTFKTGVANLTLSDPKAPITYGIESNQTLFFERQTVEPLGEKVNFLGSNITSYQSKDKLFNTSKSELELSVVRTPFFYATENHYQYDKVSNLQNVFLSSNYSSVRTSTNDFKIGILIPPNIYILQ